MLKVKTALEHNAPGTESYSSIVPCPRGFVFEVKPRNRSANVAFCIYMALDMYVLAGVSLPPFVSDTALVIVHVSGHRAQASRSPPARPWWRPSPFTPLIVLALYPFWWKTTAYGHPIIMPSLIPDKYALVRPFFVLRLPGPPAALRGLEPIEWHPSTDFAVKSGGGTVYDKDAVDLSDGDWADYCEKSSLPVSIMEIEHKFETA